MAGLTPKQSRSELRDLVLDAALLQFHPAISDASFGQSPLGLLMQDVIDVLTGDFDGHARSLAEAQGDTATVTANQCEVR